MIITICDPMELSYITDVIHDWWFDLDNFREQHGRVRALDIRNESNACHQGLLSACKLMIYHINHVDITDTERIRYYDINEISFRDGCLNITTGVPLGFRVTVSKLKLRLVCS